MPTTNLNHRDNSAPQTYGDAICKTPFNRNDYRNEIFVAMGTQHSKKWDSTRMPAYDLIDIFCRHREGSKEGPAFAPVDMVPGQRLKTTVKSLYGVGLDIDTGTPSNIIDTALAALGCMAVRYTTHSHGKTKTEIKKDKIVKYAAGREIDDNLIREFLREVEKWEPSLIATAAFNGTEHTGKGIVCTISHAPIPKHRIVLLFKEPFVIAKESATQADAMRKWARVPEALANRLGVPFDASCTDPSRIFYFPRHDKGKPFEISLFGGPYFDWRTLDIGNALESVVANLGRGKSKSVTDAGRALGGWSRDRAHGFQIADVIRDLAPDRIRNDGGNRLEIECPFDDDHSNAGDPEDRACLVVNAGEGPSEWFTVSCRHETCRDKTNLDMLGRCIAEGWFGEEAIDDERYNALASEGETQATGPLASNTDMVVADGYGGALTFTKKREPLPRGVTSDKGEKGGRTIHKSFRNCLFLIANEPWDLGFNELTQTFGLRGDCDFPWPANLGYALNDKILREIRLHLLRRWGVEMKPDDVHQAALTLAQRNTFNPAVDYLSDVEPLWDGKSRVVEWLESYMGVEANDGNRAYIRAIGKIVLIAAVRRARQPGCKFDEVLILEGEQGTGKSTAVRILGGEWFNDSNFGSLRDKSAPMKLRGVWIKEIAEMTALSRAETSELKEFTSQQVDRYRAPWGKSEEDYPRRCIFIGSLNPGGGAYLVDLTGNRRFWPVLTGEIDLDGLARDRDQIWAEAAMMETRGDTIRLHPDLYEAAKAEQAARLADEPWVEILSDYLEHYVQTRSPPRATSNELLGEEQALNLPPEKRTQTTMKKLKATMALIPHWTYKPSVRTNGVKTAGYEYTPPPKSP